MKCSITGEDFADREKPLNFSNMTRVDSTVSNNSIFQCFNLQTDKLYC